MALNNSYYKTETNARDAKCHNFVFLSSHLLTPCASEPLITLHEIAYKTTLGEVALFIISVN